MSDRNMIEEFMRNNKVTVIPDVEDTHEQVIGVGTKRTNVIGYNMMKIRRKHDRVLPMWDGLVVNDTETGKTLRFKSIEEQNIYQVESLRDGIYSEYSKYRDVKDITKCIKSGRYEIIEKAKDYHLTEL